MAVVGAGAAGLLAALSAARAGAPVVLLERTPDGGRKILVSGGGRCNILPSRSRPEGYVTDSSANTLRRMLRAWPLPEQRAFFERALENAAGAGGGDGKALPRNQTGLAMSATATAPSRACARRALESGWAPESRTCVRLRNRGAPGACSSGATRPSRRPRWCSRQAGSRCRRCSTPSGRSAGTTSCGPGQPGLGQIRGVVDQREHAFGRVVVLEDPERRSRDRSAWAVPARSDWGRRCPRRRRTCGRPRGSRR